MQAWDRYAYTNNNPVIYSDPSGHFAWLPVLVIGGAVTGAAISYVSQVINNYQSNGGDIGAAMTSNIDVGAVASAAVTGAAIGLTVAVAAPAVVGLAGQGLMGAGLMTGSTTLWSAGVATAEAGTVLATAMYGISSTSQSNNPLEGVEYTDKVLDQATWDDYHGFPEEVDAFGADGIQTEIVGNDGITRTKIEIPGGYMNRDGNFEYIIEPNGMCNHRLFVPSKNNDGGSGGC